ncbi:MAG: hypothetical protein JJU45_09770 [Acidimicrobiia bacterium]|nr:hypothetical protein [Acidimicrobiia bacterium]
MTTDAPPRAPLPPDGADPTTSGGGVRRWVGRGVAAVVAISMLGMWGWVFLYHLGGEWQQETPGRLSDTQFGLGAEAVCIDAKRELGRLPAAHVTRTPDARADAVDESNRILAAMVDELATLTTTDPSDAARVDEWLSDWQIFIEDRRSYTARLREDPAARFYVTQSDRDRRQVTLAIDRFAAVNGMPSCVVPSDLS